LEFSDSLIEAYATVDKLANYLHLPVQSGSDRILALMKRGHTALEYKARLRRLREVRPDISLSSDFIVGFPGETPADFEATMALIEAVGFDQAYSFIYSPRPGTPAAALPDDTSMTEKEARLARLQTRILALGRQYSESLVGTVQRVVVEGPSVKNPLELTGRIDCNRWVNFAGPAEWIGQMVPVRIVALRPNSLRAEAILSEVETHA
jgi:tRNA-2-methylthio-N6-dimethylallyladenosine synthase